MHQHPQIHLPLSKTTYRSVAAEVPNRKRSTYFSISRTTRTNHNNIRSRMDHKIRNIFSAFDALLPPSYLPLRVFRANAYNARVFRSRVLMLSQRRKWGWRELEGTGCRWWKTIIHIKSLTYFKAVIEAIDKDNSEEFVIWEFFRFVLIFS